MNLDDLAQVGLNAPMPEGLNPRAERGFEAGKKAATDHIIAAILRDMAKGPAALFAQIAGVPELWTHIEIERFVSHFLDYARAHPALTFEVTPIGCGHAGYQPDQIAWMFSGAPANCQLPQVFIDALASPPES